MNDVDFPVGAGARRDRRRGRRRAAREGERGRQARGSTTARSSRSPGTSAAPATSLRFIEYMDVGATNGWRLDDVVPAAEILAAVDAVFPLEPVDAAYRGEVARRYRYRDGGGEIGIIASVTQPFCGDCTRARISAEGRLYTCLFAVARSRSASNGAVGSRRRGDRRGDLARLGAPHRQVFRDPLRTRPGTPRESR